MTDTAQRKGPNLANALKYHDAHKDIPLYTMEDARRDLEAKRAQDVEDYKQSDHYADVRAVAANARKFSGSDFITPEELSDRMIKACENMAALKSYEDVDQYVLAALEGSSISQIISFLMHFPVPFMELSELAYRYSALTDITIPWELFYCVKHIANSHEEEPISSYNISPENKENLSELIKHDIDNVLEIHRSDWGSLDVKLFFLVNRPQDQVRFLRDNGINIHDAAMVAKAYDMVSGYEGSLLARIDTSNGGLFKEGNPVSEDAESLFNNALRMREAMIAIDQAKSVNH